MKIQIVKAKVINDDESSRIEIELDVEGQEHNEVVYFNAEDLITLAEMSEHI